MAAITVRVHLGAFEGQLAALQDRLLAAVTRGMTIGLRRLQTVVVDEKLAGQVLQRRSRRLIRSVRLRPAAPRGDQIVGGVEAGGGVAWYGRLHEHGTDRPFVVWAQTARALRFSWQGQTHFARSTVHPPFRERSFLRSAFTEQQTRLIDAIREALPGGR